ncbi:hypothetical protein AAVH_40357, partial [Aphelenchoides avenae]
SSRAVDYALIDFLAAQLKPQVFEVSMPGHVREDHINVMHFTQNFLRGNAKHVVYE